MLKNYGVINTRALLFCQHESRPQDHKKLCNFAGLNIYNSQANPVVVTVNTLSDELNKYQKANGAFDIPARSAVVFVVKGSKP